MNCNQNCNQSRNCDCKPAEPSIAEILIAGLLGVAIGGILGLVFVFRTGGF